MSEAGFRFYYIPLYTDYIEFNHFISVQINTQYKEEVIKFLKLLGLWIFANNY